MLEVLKEKGAVTFTEEAFSGNQAFCQVLKETNLQQQLTWQVAPLGREKHIFGKPATGPAGEWTQPKHKYNNNMF